VHGDANATVLYFGACPVVIAKMTPDPLLDLEPAVICLNFKEVEFNASHVRLDCLLSGHFFLLFCWPGLTHNR
jgi:hypothetical protein